MYQNYFNSPSPMGMNGLYQTAYNSPRQEIVKVNGENGARAYQLSANSSCLLLDENNPIVWLVQTDGAGYKTVTPYSITLYQQKQIDINEIEARLKRLEEKMSEQSDIIAVEHQSATGHENVADFKERK